MVVLSNVVGTVCRGTALVFGSSGGKFDSGDGVSKLMSPCSSLLSVYHQSSERCEILKFRQAVVP